MEPLFLKKKIAIDKELTVRVTYSQQSKTQTVSSGNEINEVVFETSSRMTEIRIPGLITTNYPVISPIL